MKTKSVNVHKIPHLQRGSTCSFLSSLFLWILLQIICTTFPDISQELIFKPAHFHVVFLKSLSSYALDCAFGLSFLINQSHQPLSVHSVIYSTSSPIGGKHDVKLSHTHRSLWRRETGAHGKMWGDYRSRPRWEGLCRDFPGLTVVFFGIPSIRKNSSRPVSGSEQDIIVQTKAPNRSPPSDALPSYPRYFPPYTLSNVVLISSNHRKTNFRIFFFQFPCLNNFAGTYRLVGSSKVQTSR